MSGRPRGAPPVRTPPRWRPARASLSPRALRLEGPGRGCSQQRCDARLLPTAAVAGSTSGRAVHVMPQPDKQVTGPRATSSSWPRTASTRFELRSDCETARQIPNGEPVFVNPGDDQPHGQHGQLAKVECSVALECDTQLFDIFGDINGDDVTTLWTFIEVLRHADQHGPRTPTWLSPPATTLDQRDNGGSSVDLLWVPRGLGRQHPAELPYGPLHVRRRPRRWRGLARRPRDNTYNFAVSGNISGSVNFPVVQQPSNWDFRCAPTNWATTSAAAPTTSARPWTSVPRASTSSASRPRSAPRQGDHVVLPPLQHGTGNITTTSTRRPRRMSLHAAACCPPTWTPARMPRRR